MRDVCVIATPQATKFINLEVITTLTNYPVRSEYKRSEEPDVFPKADAIVVVPATFNTINKWALGISDTLATGILCEALGKDLPIVAMPYFNAELAKHPALNKNIALLQEYGVRIVCSSEMKKLSEIASWKAILNAVDEAWNLRQLH